jgi:hypothetical protein
MTTLTDLLRDAGSLAGAGCLIYTSSVATTAMVAALARSKPRRDAAVRVLKILVRREP